ncbi:MAG: hypothetical protein H6581_14730 [Bacteroidia bacterium]|nr:hypothetical protein [Bacteroidia bacterium]
MENLKKLESIQKDLKKYGIMGAIRSSQGKFEMLAHLPKDCKYSYFILFQSEDKKWELRYIYLQIPIPRKFSNLDGIMDFMVSEFNLQKLK